MLWIERIFWSLLITALIVWNTHLSERIDATETQILAVHGLSLARDVEIVQGQTGILFGLVQVMIDVDTLKKGSKISKSKSKLEKLQNNTELNKDIY